MYIVNGNKKIKLVYAKSFFKRLTGLMFKKNIDYAIYFKTRAIHTFFMKKNIDVYLTNKDNKILYKYENLKKNHITKDIKVTVKKKPVEKVFELPVDNLKLEIGEIIKIEE